LGWTRTRNGLNMQVYTGRHTRGVGAKELPRYQGCRRYRHTRVSEAKSLPRYQGCRRQRVCRDTKDVGGTERPRYQGCRRQRVCRDTKDVGGTKRPGYRGVGGRDAEVSGPGYRGAGHRDIKGQDTEVLGCRDTEVPRCTHLLGLICELNSLSGWATVLKPTSTGYIRRGTRCPKGYGFGNHSHALGTLALLQSCRRPGSSSPPPELLLVRVDTCRGAVRSALRRSWDWISAGSDRGTAPHRRASSIPQLRV
jgi:hypothetical protein